MSDHPAIDEVLSRLKNFPAVPITQQDNTLSVEAKYDNGFRVELIDNSTEFTVYCDMWFNDYIFDYEQASKLFLFSLTTAARLRVKEKNQKRYWFGLESSLDGIVGNQLSTFYPKFYSFWKKKKVYYLQNDWIDIEKFKPWINNN